jgi:hypothetical protein
MAGSLAITLTGLNGTHSKALSFRARFQANGNYHHVKNRSGSGFQALSLLTDNSHYVNFVF